MTERVSVVGGGVVGTTTALFLSLKGYETRVYAERVPYSDETVPSMATGYAAASVKPVHVDLEDIEGVERDCEGYFERLRGRTETVRAQKDFEVYEEGTDVPETDRGYSSLDGYDGAVPTRSGGDTGYLREILFVEMPEYVPALRGWYEDAGGEIERVRVERDELSALDGETVVNCTGYPNLFGDDDLGPLKGHLVHLDTDGRLTDEEGEDFCYTYYMEDGRFVYAYPRNDALVLGGSAYEGRVVDGEWRGEGPEETTEVDGVEVPRHIVDVNRELIESVCGVDIAEYDATAEFGYRPYRHGGVRTEREEYMGKEVVHCYGHGGAGVTMSWLSANRVYNLVSGDSGLDHGVVDGI